MESNDGEDHSQKLLLAQTHIWNHFFSFINSMSLKCAIELNILDVVHNYGQPMPLSELIASLPIQPSKAAFVPRLMRILTLSGFFSNQNDDDQQEESNKSPLEMEHGRAFWEFASHDQKLSNSFHEAMTSDSRLIASVVIEKCKDTFEGLESLVDVGGGNGTMAKAIAKSFPNVECIVFDLPHVVAGFQGSSDKNIKYVGGDMFEAIPSADSVLLKCILHNWSDEDCVKLLKKCKEATMKKGKKGKVIIIDMVVGNENGDNGSLETQLYYDMAMMAFVTGKERTEKEWAKLFFSSGFSNYKIIPILMSSRSLIEVYP
ncbi:probable O-methyltransferase 3 isoform X2 [Arachis ipaensis]|uniref:probable O-methyltransferase 3 isoform X2 n=1 Tax=Arachis ipaensis TaxID=130454 RepID=UPI000A2B2A19|nr:probable O-methyltransferase 3 isoform X2 [Arachis ipaensis]